MQLSADLRSAESAAEAATRSAIVETMTRDELRHLIDIIVAEVAAATGRPRRLCSCHSVVDDCCPDRLRGVLDAGATRVGLHATGGAPAAVAAMIDHTLLKPDATPAEHRRAVPRGGAVQVRDRLRQPDLGRRLRAAAAGHRRRRLLGRRLSAGRDDGRREGLRDAPGDLRRRARNRHGDQRRRAQVGRPARGRARHRGGHRAVPRLRRAQQGHHRGRAADRRREGRRRARWRRRPAPTT